MAGAADTTKEALKLVATDRQLAQATSQAIKRWARDKKATSRTVKALAFAAAIDDALASTAISRAEGTRT